MLALENGLLSSISHSQSLRHPVDPVLCLLLLVHRSLVYVSTGRGKDENNAIDVYNVLMETGASAYSISTNGHDHFPTSQTFLSTSSSAALHSNMLGSA